MFDNRDCAATILIVNLVKYEVVRESSRATPSQPLYPHHSDAKQRQSTGHVVWDAAGVVCQEAQNRSLALVMVVEEQEEEGPSSGGSIDAVCSDRVCWMEQCRKGSKLADCLFAKGAREKDASTHVSSMRSF